MLTRYDEQVWYKVLCGHNAPRPTRGSRDWEAEREARYRLLVSVADERDAGTPTREIAKKMNWSISYTQERIRFGRWWKEWLARRGALAVIAIMAISSPAFAGGGIGQLAPLGGLAYRQPYYQPPPRIETVIPDGFGGYHVFRPGRPWTTVQPDGFGGYTIFNGVR